MTNALPAVSECPIALVTGASAVGGGEIARALGRAGYDVAVIGRRADALRLFVEEREAAGGKALALTTDLRDAMATEAALDGFLTWSHGRVDVVVNAAGAAGPLSHIGELDVAAFDNVIATNLRAPFLILSRLLPLMRAAGHGRVVNIGGNDGLRGRAGRSSFSASKWGLRGLTRSAALEAGADGVTVNYIAPGPIAAARHVTDMENPLGRPMAPEDIVAMVMFLVGPGGRSITGQELVVDGGTTI